MLLLISNILSAQNNNILAKMYLLNDGSIYMLENESLFKKTINEKVLVGHNSGVRSEKFGDRKNPLNFTLTSNNELLSLYFNKGWDGIIFNKDQYWDSRWTIRYECRDMNKELKTFHGALIPSFEGLKIKGDIHFPPRCFIYYDFVEYNNQMLLFLTSGENLYILKAKSELCDAEWELFSTLTVSEGLGNFISYVNENNRIVLTFSSSQEIELGNDLNNIYKSGISTHSGTLLVVGNKNYWIAEDEAKLLSLSNDPVEFFNKKIINNEK